MSIKIALASASPRRKELLGQLGIAFTVVSASVDESIQPAEPAAAYVSRLALAKAQAGARRLSQPLPVLGADTSVVVDQQILGKPASFEEFAAMMQLLSGRRHQVMTAIALVTAEQQLQALSTTEVWFRTLQSDEIFAYWQSGEPRDKAGGYAIQGLAARFVSRIEGSYSGVVGLPLFETDQLLQQLRGYQ